MTIALNTDTCLRRVSLNSKEQKTALYFTELWIKTSEQGTIPDTCGPPGSMILLNQVKGLTARDWPPSPMPKHPSVDDNQQEGKQIKTHASSCYDTTTKSMLQNGNDYSRVGMHLPSSCDILEPI